MASRDSGQTAAPGWAGLLKTKVFGDASWALLGQVGSGLVLLVGTRVITELVSPEVYGQVALMAGIVALAVGVFAYPFIFAGMRLLPEVLLNTQRRTLQGILNRYIGLASLLALLLIVGGGLAYGEYAGGGDPRLFAIAGLLFLVTVRRELGVQLFIGERRQRAASLWQTGDSLLRPLFAIGLVCIVGPSAIWVLSGYALASLIGNSLAGFLSKTRQPGQSNATPLSDGTLRSEVLAYALPLIPLELLVWFSGLGDRYVIGYLMTAADVGLYAAAYTLTNEAFNRSALVLLRTFQPLYFSHSSLGERGEAARVFKLWLFSVMALGVTGVLALTLLRDWVAGLLLAREYHAAAVLMPIIGVGCALQALSMVLAQPLYAMKKTRALLAGRLFGAVIAAVSIPSMVMWQGLLGAALAAPVYFGAEALAMALLARSWRMRLSSERDELVLVAETATTGSPT